jgi:rhodanese-related sulfurtransferase
MVWQTVRHYEWKAGQFTSFTMPAEPAKSPPRVVVDLGTKELNQALKFGWDGRFAAGYITQDGEPIVALLRQSRIERLEPRLTPLGGMRLRGRGSHGQIDADLTPSGSIARAVVSKGPGSLFADKGLSEVRAISPRSGQITTVSTTRFELKTAAHALDPRSRSPVLHWTVSGEFADGATSRGEIVTVMRFIPYPQASSYSIPDGTAAFVAGDMSGLVREWRDGEVRTVLDEGTVHATREAVRAVVGSTAPPQPVARVAPKAAIVALGCALLALVWAVYRLVKQSRVAPMLLATITLGMAASPARASDGVRDVLPTYCGLYALAGAAEVLERELPLESLFQAKYVGSHDGSSLGELKQAAQDHGLHALPVENLSLSALRATGLPAILHVRKSLGVTGYGHWVLFVPTVDGAGAIVDAPQSPQSLAEAQLTARWNGVALILSNAPVRLSAGRSLLASGWGYGVVMVAIACLLRWTIGQRGLTLQPWGVAAIVSLAICASLAYALFAENGLLADTASLEAVKHHSAASTLPRVTTEELRRAVEDRSARIIDVRFHPDFVAGRIPGAIRVPPGADQAEIIRRLGEPDEKTTYVLYCQSPNCPFSSQIATKMLERGYRDVRLYKPGWSQWHAAHPTLIERGAGR